MDDLMPFFLGALWSESWLLLLLLGLLTGPSCEPVELWGQKTTLSKRPYRATPPPRDLEIWLGCLFLPGKLWLPGPVSFPGSPGPRPAQRAMLTPPQGLLSAGGAPPCQQLRPPRGWLQRPGTERSAQAVV